ncbi:SIMPL domain-containing protein [Actinoplanes philippinensis]|uniref:SIMPL domain-containing protein n=1 Tax=Actinoplanes philippinensis TaxID=35752 RepID=UPI0033C17855
MGPHRFRGVPRGDAARRRLRGADRAGPGGPAGAATAHRPGHRRAEFCPGLSAARQGYGSERPFHGYERKASHVMESRGLDTVQQLMPDLITVGTTEIRSADFRTTTKQDLRATARRQAVTAARRKAVAVARRKAVASARRKAVAVVPPRRRPAPP